MTDDKRFKLKDYGYDGWAVEDTTGEIFENDYLEDMSEQQVVDTLNELYEENQELKNKCAFLEEFLKKGVQYEYYQQIHDENKQLKKELDQLKNMVEHNYVEHKRCVNNYVDKIKEVEKENEQLKSELKALRKKYNDFSDAVDKRLPEMGKRLLG